MTGGINEGVLWDEEPLILQNKLFCSMYLMRNGKVDQNQLACDCMTSFENICFPT